VAANWCLTLLKSFGGSGYDIMRKMTLIVYHLDQGVPSIEQVTFNPFTNHLYFVYLNKKQSSKKCYCCMKWIKIVG
jgi:hypothetical protein